VRRDRDGARGGLTVARDHRVDTAVAPPLVATTRPTSPALGAAESRIFFGTTAILALHAAVDAFLAPEPGTAPGDHLLRGLVAIGILALGAAVYPRVPAGSRAAIAGVLGILALEGAALAIADARAVGPHGEDWTGFLLVPAGLVLLVLAATLLWRSRKGGRLRYLRRGAIGLATVLAAYWLLAPVAIAIIATHRPRADVAPANLGRPYEEVTIRTGDGLDLAAWYVPSRNGAAVISYPTRQGKLPHARMLARHGYGVLLLDARGYDGSEGDPNLFGWDGHGDVEAAVAWLRARRDVGDGRIGGIGFSVGGEVMIEAAATTAGLRAVVSEGAGVRSVREHLLRGPRGWFSLPEAALESAAVAVVSGTAPPPSLADLVAQISPRPVFLIHAGEGAGGEELNPAYYRAASAPKTLWTIPNAGHVGGLEAQPQEYERRVVGFFDRTLLAGSASPP
jgi:uncharacterized protein